MTLSSSGFLLLLPAAALAAAVLSLAMVAGATGRTVSRASGRDPAGGDATGAGGEPGTPTGLSSPAVRAALGTGLALLAMLAALQLDLALGLDTDDAPITFRYAENLAMGRGFVYNTGEHVLGTSTPLFTLMLAGLRLAGVPVETGALLIALISAGALLALVLRAGRSLVSPAAAWFAAALLCTEAPWLVYTTQGMETSSYLALVLACLVLHAEGRDRSAWLLAGLCVVMRLDGLAVPAALGLSTLAGRRLPSRAAVLLFVIVTVPWFAWSLAEFGTPLPQSMIAKVLVHTHHAERWWMPSWLFVDGTLLLVPFGMIGALALCTGGGAARRSVLPLWTGLYAAAFTVTPIDAYPWYRIPLVPALALLAGEGVCRTGSALIARWPEAGRRRLRIALLLVLAVWGAGRYIVYHDSLAAYAEQLRVWERPRVAAAEWLRDHAPPGSSVRTSAIGHIGWISGLAIQDTSGLVSPGALTGDLPPADFIVGHDGDPRPGAVFRVDDPDYDLVQSLAVEPTVVYRIYRRKGTPLR